MGKNQASFLQEGLAVSHPGAVLWFTQVGSLSFRQVPNLSYMV